ncbi:MAG: hypothetical protein QXU98_04515 [Candidatus Parvarchaeota archaeon]
MPAKPEFIPENIQGVRVAFQKLYPFNPIMPTVPQVFETIKLTAQESGLFYIAIYFYSNPADSTCGPGMFPQSQYYPPGSTNFSQSTYWNYNYLGNGSGYALLGRYLQPELTCQTIVSYASSYSSDYAAPPPTGGPPWYNYICNYKYNPAYRLIVYDGAGYLTPGTSTWLAIANGCGAQPYGYVAIRAIAIWEVY